MQWGMYKLNLSLMELKSMCVCGAGGSGQAINSKAK